LRICDFCEGEIGEYCGIGFLNKIMFSIFQEFPNLVVEISTKQDGPMRLAGDKEQDIQAWENRERFFKKIGIDKNSVVRASLAHGQKAVIVSAKDAGKALDETDALVTAGGNLFLVITVADCLPIFFYDPQKEIIGLAHAGWRGLANGVIRSTIEKMLELGANADNILVGIGPGIGVCHYSISDKSKEEILEKFKVYLKDVLVEREGKKFLDLPKIAKMQLKDLGIKEGNIEDTCECTYCLTDKYFSARRDKSDPLQTMLVVVGMRK